MFFANKAKIEIFIHLLLYTYHTHHQPSSPHHQSTPRLCIDVASIVPLSEPLVISWPPTKPKQEQQSTLWPYVLLPTPQQCLADTYKTPTEHIHIPTWPPLQTSQLPTAKRKPPPPPPPHVWSFFSRHLLISGFFFTFICHWLGWLPCTVPTTAPQTTHNVTSFSKIPTPSHMWWSSPFKGWLTVLINTGTRQHTLIPNQHSLWT